MTGFCRSPVEMRKTSNNSNPQTAVSTPNRQLSDSEKLRKVIMELVDTERTYVKVISCVDRLNAILILFVLTAFKQPTGKLSRTTQEGNILIQR